MHTSIAQWLASLLLDPAVPGSNHGSGFISDKISNVAVLLDSGLLVHRTVKSLIKLIEPIQYRLMTSYYLKKSVK